jgi:hypothetical protein
LILGWLLPLVLLALPNCGLQTSGGCCLPVDECSENDPECNEGSDDPVNAFQPGYNQQEAIFCDIPKPLAPGDDGCASQEEAEDPANISLSEAATALFNGETNSFALDFSAAATAACPNGLPKKIKFFGKYPQGMTVCINCGTQIDDGDPYDNPTQACIAKCKDEVNKDGLIPAEGTDAYCEANARISTNLATNDCYLNVCINGSPNMTWDDPREEAEPVMWTDFIGTDDGSGSNSLARTADTTGGTTADFNAGAASVQMFAKGGDGWVEFAAGDGTDKVHVLGLRTSSCTDPVSCPDDDPHISTVGFAIDLNSDGMVYVLEPDDAAKDGFVVYGPFGPYTAGERYRIRITDNHDHTATIAYLRLVGGVEQPPFAFNIKPAPQYPLRVDTSLREVDAVLSDVTLVRIK